MSRRSPHHLAPTSDPTLQPTCVIEPVPATDFFLGDIEDAAVLAVDEFVFAGRFFSLSS